VKVLFICEPISPHAARWINQFANTNVDIHIVSESNESNLICADLQVGTVYLPNPSNVPDGVKAIATNSSEFVSHVEMIGRLIDHLKPDLIHTLGMYVNGTNRCVVTAALREKLDYVKKIPWLYSSWGMDLDWFSADGEGREIAKRVAAQVDFYQSECERDVKYFDELGYKGKRLECLPAFGGITWSVENQSPLSERKTLVLKARDQADGDIIGKAFNMLPALAQNADILRDYKIIAMQSGPSFRLAATKLNEKLGLSIECPDRLPKQSDVLDFYRKARAWYAMTLNDGLPSSLVEAMSLGTLPVHSDLSSIREWVKDGVNGLLVQVDNIEGIVQVMRRSLTDDFFVQSAMDYNKKFVEKYWTEAVVKPKAFELYFNITGKRVN
jgi:hypothetical protein